MYTCCIQIHSVCSNMMTNQSTVVIKTCFRISLLIFSFYWMISHDIIKNINKTYFVKGSARLTPRMRHKITTMSHDYSLILISDQKQFKKKSMHILTYTQDLKRTRAKFQGGCIMRSVSHSLKIQ